MAGERDDKDRTLFCGNLNEQVTEDILFELFLQAGPLEKVKIPLDMNSGRKKNFGFVTFKHDISVPYTIELMNGISLYGKPIKLQSRQGSIHQQNAQGNFNRSISAPTMGPGQNYRDMSGYGTPPQHMQRGQTFSGGGGGQFQPNIPSPLTAGSGNHPDNYNNERSQDRGRNRYNDNDNNRGRRFDRSDSGHRGGRDRDDSYDSRGNRNNYDNRQNSREGDNSNSSRDRSYERHGSRDNNRDRSRDNDRDRHNSRGSGFDTPPRPTRMDSIPSSGNRSGGDRSDGSSGGLEGVPLMNPTPQQDIEQLRLNVMAQQQRQLQFNQMQMQMQAQQMLQGGQQWGSRQGGGSGGGRYQGRR